MERRKGIKVQNKIYLRDLSCYLTANEKQKNHPLMEPNRYFDLSKLTNENIKKEMDMFIRWRGEKLSPLSIRGDIYPFNQLSRCLNEECPKLQTFVEIDQKQMEKNCRKWLLKHEKNLTQRRIRTESGKEQVMDAALIKYVQRICCFFNKEERSFKFDSETWYLNDIPIILRVNPTKRINSINFKKIHQKFMKEEVKKIIYIHLSQKALGTVCAEMTAINRFSKYLSEQYSEVQSLREIDRELLENYLVHTNTEAKGRKSYSKELQHLKAIFRTAANVLEDPNLSELFYRDDIGKQPVSIYKVYSDNELIRLNRKIVEMDEQIARALILHQLLGTRISETLTLTQDAVRRGVTGQWVIRIFQIKSRREYEKVINDDVKALFDKACLYTKNKYGVGKYVFVDEKDPKQPMQYSRMQYQIMAMIRKNDLLDDNGEKFGVGTHIFRHCYGKKLTDMHIDDLTIAKLLGHANSASVKNYRKIGNELLSEETRNMRDNMDDILKNMLKDWNE